MRRRRSVLVVMVVLTAAVLLPVHGARAAAVAVDLGSAAPFAVLAGSTVTIGRATTVNGDVGVHPGTAVTITEAGKVNGTIYAGGTAPEIAMATAAKADLATAYSSAGAQGEDVLLFDDLGGMTLGPGLYSFGAAATLGGTLTLDGGGNPDAVFIIQIGSTITTAASSAVVLTGGAQACRVTWLIGSSATLGADTSFKGDVLATTSITAVAGTTVDGRLLAIDGAVTLDNNTVTATTCLPPVTTTSTTTSTTGVLSISPASAGNFASRSITGVAQTTTADLAHFSVSDPRGTGAGWHVTAHATTFTGAAGRVLAAGSLSMSVPGVTPADLSSPTVATGPYMIDVVGSPVRIATAALNKGLGTYLFAATTLTLALPANVYADAYTSTITISVVSAP